MIRGRRCVWRNDFDQNKPGGQFVFEGPPGKIARKTHKTRVPAATYARPPCGNYGPGAGRQRALDDPVEA
jgi:hypothetical protein